jgi:hypothetical protein
MKKLLDGLDNYIDDFQNISDRTGLIKKEILISYLVSRCYGREVRIDRLNSVHSEMKKNGIKNKLFEKYIIETLIAVVEGPDKSNIEQLYNNLNKLRSHSIKINFITKLFLVISRGDFDVQSIKKKYNQLARSNHFIKKTKLLPVVFYLDKFNVSIDEFNNKYNELIGKLFVKSSELMYLSLLTIKYDINLDMVNGLTDKRAFYPLYAALELFNIQIDDDKLAVDLIELKGSTNIHVYEDNYYLIILIEYLLKDGRIKEEINRDIFDIIMLHILITLMKEIVYMD